MYAFGCVNKSSWWVLVLHNQQPGQTQPTVLYIEIGHAHAFSVAGILFQTICHGTFLLIVFGTVKTFLSCKYWHYIRTTLAHWNHLLMHFTNAFWFELISIRYLPRSCWSLTWGGCRFVCCLVTESQLCEGTAFTGSAAAEQNIEPGDWSRRTQVASQWTETWSQPTQGPC